MSYRHPEQFTNVRIRKDLLARVKMIAAKEKRTTMGQLDHMVEKALKAEAKG